MVIEFYVFLTDYNLCKQSIVAKFAIKNFIC